MVFDNWKQALLGISIFSLSCCSIFMTLWYPMLVFLVLIIMIFGSIGSVIIPNLIWNDEQEMYKEIRKKVKNW